jgi:ATP-dependent Clp protease ATP-binding subunit ClpX
MAANDTQYRCSFCEKDRSIVKRLIAGPRGVFICDDCVGLATEILRDEPPGGVEPQ